MYTMRIFWIFIFPFCAVPANLSGQAPPDLVTPLIWKGQYGTLSEAEFLFNEARRAEENQFGLPEGSLGLLQFPEGYASWTPAQQVLFLVNSERTCRAGLDYDGDGPWSPVLGKPLTAISANLSAIAAGHVEWMLRENAFSHQGANGQSSFQRVDQHPVLGPCHEHIDYGENLYLAGTSGSVNPQFVERAVFSWIYGSNAHRRGTLLQATNPYGSAGYTDNFDQNGSEGFMGVALGGSDNGSYNPYNWSFANRVDVIVFMFMDPVADLACTYELTYLPEVDTCPPVGEDLFLDQLIAAGDDISSYSSTFIENQGQVEENGTWKGFAQEGVFLTPGFHAQPGSRVVLTTFHPCLDAPVPANAEESIHYDARDQPEVFGRAFAKKSVRREDLVFPNPAFAGNTLHFPTVPKELRLWSTGGQLHRGPINLAEKKWTLPKVMAGIYFLSWCDQHGVRRVQPLVVLP